MKKKHESLTSAFGTKKIRVKFIEEKKKKKSDKDGWNS